VMTALSLMPKISRTLRVQRLRSCDERHAASCAEKLEGTAIVGWAKALSRRAHHILALNEDGGHAFALPTLRERA
jgi:hypothetical protein